MESARRFKAQKKWKSSWEVIKKLMSNDAEVDKLKLDNDEVEK